MKEEVEMKEEKWETVYKVAFKDLDGRTKSPVASPVFTETYEIGKETAPSIGKLYCYRDKGDAIASASDEDCVFECKGVIHEVEREIVRLLINEMSMENVERFWSCKDPWSLLEDGLIARVPPGTILCSKVVPLKIIHSNGQRCNSSLSDESKEYGE